MRISDWSSDVCSSDLFGDWRGLPGFVHVGDQRYAELGLHGFENPQAFFEAGAAIGVDRRAVGLVETGLEDVGNAQFPGDTHVLCGGLQGDVFRFEDVDAAEKDERRRVSDDDRSEEHTSELQSLMRNSYAVICLT